MKYIWGIFLAMVGMQILNAGSVSQGAEGLRITLAPVGWLPFTWFKAEAIVQLVRWAAVAVLCVACDRVGFRRWLSARGERLVLWAAVALAVLGIAQYYTGATAYLWHFPLKPKYEPRFFSLFAYINNAGTFFMLAAGMALARSWRNWPLVALFAYCTVLTGTRAAWPMIAALVAVKAIGELPARVRWDLYLILGVAMLAGFAAVMPYLMSQRWHEYWINAQIVAHYPAWGVGVWGQYAAEWLYAPKWLFSKLRTMPNAHCDPMIFAVEYGLVGAGLLAAIACRLVRPLGERLVTSCRGLAVSLVAVHSLFDMPLRNPLILIMLVVLLTAERKVL